MSRPKQHIYLHVASAASFALSITLPKEIGKCRLIAVSAENTSTPAAEGTIYYYPQERIATGYSSTAGMVIASNRNNGGTYDSQIYNTDMNIIANGGDRIESLYPPGAGITDVHRLWVIVEELPPEEAPPSKGAFA